MDEKKKLEDILELTPDMLEQISGGVMTDRADEMLNALIIALKKDQEKNPEKEHTPDELIEFVTGHLLDNVNFEGVTAEDVADYVNAHWNA